MKKFLATLLMGGLLIASSVSAEIKTYDGVGEYIISNFETPDVAKQRAKLYTERNVQEKAGVYIRSYSKTFNFEFGDYQPAFG